MLVAEWLARCSIAVGARSQDPRVLAFTLTSTAGRLPRSPRGLAIADRMAADPNWHVRYVAALVLGESWASHATPDTLIALAQDDSSLVRAALARGVAAATVSLDDFAVLAPACRRIARHARVRRDWEARQSSARAPTDMT